MTYTFTEGAVVDTDKLQDVDAMLMEAAIHLFNLAKQYDRGIIISIEAQPISSWERGCFFIKHRDNASYQTIFQTLKRAIQLHSKGTVDLVPTNK